MGITEFCKCSTQPKRKNKKETLSICPISTTLRLLLLSEIASNNSIFSPDSIFPLLFYFLGLYHCRGNPLCSKEAESKDSEVRLPAQNSTSATYIPAVRQGHHLGAEFIKLISLVIK